MPIAIITAKGFSKRLKNKNLKSFFGKPLIAWSILILKKTKLFKKIVVSTDSNSITKISKIYGADIIIKRPKNLCKNNVTTIRVIKHAIRSLKKIKIHSNFFCCMYPAAPNTYFKNINLAYKIIQKNKLFVFPCVTKKNLKTKLQTVKSINKKKINHIFNDAGQFYFASKKTWLKSKKIIKKKSIIITLSENDSVDINTHKDFLKSKKIFKKKHE